MTRIAAISVQTIARLPAARPAAPVTVKAAETEKPSERAAPVREAAKLAGEALAVLIAAQAHRDDRHEDPRPEHGGDHGHGHDHGHQPPPVNDPPPVVQPPVVQPPVVQPPVSDPPPVMQPPGPVPTPIPAPVAVVGDPAAAIRASAMISKVFAESAVAEAARSAFAAAAAERRSAAYVAEGQAALALLQGVRQYESVRRSAIG